MLGSELRTRRERLGLTQEELAQRLSVHRTTVNRWEQNRLTIERPAVLRVLIQAIEEELAADPAWQQERSRRLMAQAEAADAARDPYERELAAWWARPATTRGPMPARPVSE